MHPTFTRGSRSNELTVDLEAIVEESVSVAVVLVVSAYTGTTIDELPPLGGTVDPDALDDLLQPLSSDPEVSSTLVEFRYCGFDIAISSTGEMCLRRLEEW